MDLLAPTGGKLFNGQPAFVPLIPSFSRFRRDVEDVILMFDVFSHWQVQETHHTPVKLDDLLERLHASPGVVSRSAQASINTVAASRSSMWSQRRPCSP